MKSSFRSNVLARLQATGCEVREDLTGCRRRVKAEIFPGNCREIETVLRLARDLRLKIHAVSCGRNWGFGSELPPRQNCLVLNLSRMNHIRRLDLAHHLVEVEPGVTQGHLADRLKAEGDSHFLNVTGAGLSASVLGNALERGIGYFGSRDLDLLGLEVMLGSGEVVRTGYDAEIGDPAAPLGPRLEGLFVQSGFGLITSGTISLSRRAQAMGAVTLDLAQQRDLAPVVDRLGDILAEGWIRDVPHFFNRKRLETTFGGEAEKWPAWLAVVPLRGSPRLVLEMASEIKGRMGPHARVRQLGLGPACGEDCPELRAILPLLQGNPIDLALFSMARTISDDAAPVAPQATFDPEKGNAGLIHVTPSCHLDGSSVLHLLDIVNRVSRLNGLDELPLSLNTVNPRYACLVISVCYKRNSLLQKSSARKLADSLLFSAVAEGFQPYRLGLEQADLLPVMAGPLRKTCLHLQRVFDPAAVFAQSRYAPLWMSAAGKKRQSTSVLWPTSEAQSFLKTVEKHQHRCMGSLCAKNGVS
jgi:4-cresol dehydrogenase (hydroxylating)